MHASRRQILLTAAAAGLASAAPLRVFAQGAAAGPVADPRLAALLDAFVDEILRENPAYATGLGLDNGRYADLRSRLNDRTAAGRAREIAAYADRAKRLRAIPRSSLKGRDLTLYDTVLYAMDLGAEGGRFAYGQDYANPYVVSQQDGSVANVPEFLNSQHPVETREDAEAYLARLDQLGAAIDAETERTRDAAARGVVPPAFILATVVKQLTDARAVDPAASRMATSVAERARAKGIAGDWQARAAAIVAEKVYPAIGRQLEAIQALQASATNDAGVWKFKDGADYYRWSLKYNTTTDLSPDEIHRIGLEQGREIDGIMDAILKSQGITQGTVGERMSALTHDPRFLYPNTDEGKRQVLAEIEKAVDGIRPYISQFSKLGLKAPVEVRAVPKEIEAGAALGYMNFASLDGSRPAIYYVNLSDTANWPKYTLASLSMHEALPGHAWQGAYLAERSNEIHTISSLIGFGAFVEGWALYAEQLADEVGFYKDDPFGRLGYLQALRFRCARLVVDTGLHEKRWTREKAIQELAGATGRSIVAATSEVDRYCASPGQACAYKVGHNEIVRLREKAKAALGPKFDLRDYNDLVVTTGGAPLAVLETVVDRHIAAVKG
jgi:Uncharacterized protein conserved in bacteria